jgi:hypothetical protein
MQRHDLLALLCDLRAYLEDAEGESEVDLLVRRLRLAIDYFDTKLTEADLVDAGLRHG